MQQTNLFRSLVLTASFSMMAAPFPILAAPIPGEPTINVTGSTDNIPLLCRNLMTNVETRNNHILANASLGGVMLLRCSDTGVTAFLPGDRWRIVTTITLDHSSIIPFTWYASGLLLESVKLTRLKTGTSVTLQDEDVNEVFSWPYLFPLESGDRVKLEFVGTVKDPAIAECPCGSPERLEWVLGVAPGMQCFLFDETYRRECSVRQFSVLDTRTNLSQAEVDACKVVMYPVCPQ